MSNVSLRTREHRVSYYRMSYVEMALKIPPLEKGGFDRLLRGLLFEYVPIKHYPHIIDELSRTYPQLRELMPQRR